MRSRKYRYPIAYALPVLVGGVLLFWNGPPAASPASAPERSALPAGLDGSPPEPLAPTGGPYVDPGQIRGAAFQKALDQGIERPHLTRVLAMTYGESVAWNQGGRSMLLHPDREVYVVSVDGSITIARGHHGRRSFTRSYYVFDASTGDLVQWGATNLPEPQEDVRDRER